LVEQINHYKLTIKQKDKKVEKHKDYIGKLKNSLESVLAEHKR
jgi:N-acetylneuraminic acid mutarotase